MAPLKKLKTYSRGNNSTINCVDALNILFAKNIAARKLNGKIKKKKTQLEVKELPKTIRSVFSDESSLHVNINDTFDQVCRGTTKNNDKCKNLSVSIISNNLSMSVINHQNVGNISPKVTKISSSYSATGNCDNTVFSWFKNPTVSAERISNELEVEMLGKDVKNASKRKKKSYPSRESPILLRSHSKLPEITVDTAEKSDNATGASIILNKSNINCSTSYNQVFTNSVREHIAVHSSTPLAPKRTKSLIQPISPIKQFEQEMQSCFIESMDEIKQWNTSLSFPTKRRKKTGQNGSFITTRTRMRAKLARNEYNNSKLCSLDEFELFHSKLTENNGKQEYTSFSFKDFEDFHAKCMSGLYQQSEITNFVTNRKARVSLADQAALNKKDLVIILDKLVVQDVSPQRKKKRFVDCSPRRVTRLSLKLQNDREKNNTISRKFRAFSTPARFLNSSYDECVNNNSLCNSFEFNRVTIEEINAVDAPDVSTNTSRSLPAHNPEESIEPSSIEVFLPTAQEISTRQTQTEILATIHDLSECFSQEESERGPDLLVDLTLDDQEDMAKREVLLLSITRRCSMRRSSKRSMEMIESSLTTPEQELFMRPQLPIQKRIKMMNFKTGKSWRRSLLESKRESLIDLTESVNDAAFRPSSSNVRFSTTSRRNSVKIVPVQSRVSNRRQTTLQNYAKTNLSTIFGESLEDIIGIPSPSIQNHPLPTISAKDIVLERCDQSEPVNFTTRFPDSSLKKCKKIGEGVYGEVFMREENGKTTVMKVIPIEGNKFINGERQKKFHEILSEVIIALELSNLRMNDANQSSGFCEVQSISCVIGKYPERLIELWHAYDAQKGSENDPPDVFDETQLYIVLSLCHAGQDLESYVFNNSVTAISMFRQVAYSLAVAESSLKFEHRDLHWGNVLLRPVHMNRKITFKFKDERISFSSKGVEATIIDFTLSRIQHDGVVIFNDLGLDPDLFVAEGDYQFDIYRLMKEKNGNDWEKFEPYSNILWLHYVVKKAIKELRYKNTNTKAHTNGLQELEVIERRLLDFESASDFVSSFW